MQTGTKAFATAVLVAVLCVSHATASCYTFYEGLCPGASNCMCTLGESCGGSTAEKNATKARAADGGCSGSCRTVMSGLCPGDASCLYDAGSCGGPAPPPPPPPSSGSLGGDVCTHSDSSAWSCAVSKGWSFMVVRSYKSYGAPDSNALPTIQAAKAGGITETDVYHFPCAGSDAASQVQDDVNAVGKGNFGRMWFDIETNPSSGCGWSSDVSSNCNFLRSMISAGSSMGIQMGVYSSSYMWSSIMGNSCSAGADSGLPLWYAHYDGTRSFNDFSSFGGWSSPTMKQYSDDSTIGSSCGISADADYAAI